MSLKAQEWAFDSGIPPGPRFVLVVLADHAGDHKGEDWSCYPSMARICDKTGQAARTVERHLVWLVEQGWISRRRRRGRERDDGAYIYTLHRARGVVLACGLPANLAGDGASEPPANMAGDQAQPPANLAPTTRQNGSDYPPNRRFPPDPPIELNRQGTVSEPARGAAETETVDAVVQARAFGRLRDAWARVSPGRVAPGPAERAFQRQAEAVHPARIADAGERYLRQDADVAKFGAMRLHVWLDERRYEPWLVAGDGGRMGTAPITSWTGPAEIRAAVVDRHGEGFAASYLDPASWDGERRVVKARTGFACRKLSEVELPGVSFVEVVA